MRVVDRLLSHVEKSDTGCWVWRAYVKKDGYGRVGIGRRVVLAHRAMYMALVGPIQHGLSLDHLCRNKACVNPSHLEPVTHAENIRRGSQATKSVCVNGHPLSGENLRMYKRKKYGMSRICRACCRIKSRKERAKRSAP